MKSYRKIFSFVVIIAGILFLSFAYPNMQDNPEIINAIKSGNSRLHGTLIPVLI